MEAGKAIKGYELYERIGSGGFGVVHRAYQATVGREVAIKIILPHFANHPDFIRRFETEAQLVARLEHPFIVPLYDYWRDTDGAYLVMRWLRGGSLRGALASGSFQLEAAVLFMEQISSALALAHRNGVVHRDLKPANILLDEDGHAYLSDFGIAKDIFNAASSQTGTDVVLGSPDYLSPEQARSEPVSPQTDIYSLGVMLYEVLTGQHPFPNMTSVERMYKHLNEPLPLIETLSPEVSAGINAIVQKATAKNPALRYGDVLEMAAAFRQETAQSQRPGENVVEQLTLREHEVLQMVLDGCSNKEIAQHLSITMGTVKWHIRQVYQKLHVRSRVQAIVRARELNLIVTDTGADSAPPLESTFVALPEPENPYKGLRAFQTVDVRDFFGRERLIQQLIKRMGEHDRLARFLAVVGPSGSGKSSAVKAGLVPALWRGDLPSSERWFVVEMVPGAHPLDELEIALSRVAANQAGNLRDHLERDARGLVRAAGLILPDDGSELVVIVDQLEEAFTLVADEAQRVHFLDLLYTAVTDPRSRVRVVITLRADFYDRPLHYPEFGELMRSRMETILPLSADELEAVIVQPTARVGVSFEPGLVATITADVHYQPGALPLLQYALTELFEQRSQRTLTLSAYRALGGATGALAKRADALYHEQDDAGQEVIRQMFLRLVTFGEDARDARRRVARSELLAVAGGEDRMEDAIDAYAAYRLLTLDHDPVTRSPTVEIAHEAILREWERLRSWLTESHEDIRQQRLLAAAAADWLQAGKDASYLLRGARLELFAGWVAEAKLALTPEERAFLDTSLTERQREETAEQQRYQRELETQRQLAEQRQRSANRLRYLVVGLTAFLLVAILLAIFAFDREMKAQDARTKAQQEADVNRSLVLAGHAQQAYDQGRTNVALALALQATRIEPVQPEALAALRTVARGYGIRAQWKAHQHDTKAVAISPDSRLAVSVSCAEMTDAVCRKGELALWNLENGALVRRWTGHQNWVNDVAFSPDGKWILSGAVDGTLILWEASTASIVQQWAGPPGASSAVLSLAFAARKAPANPLLAIAGFEDGTIHVWAVPSGDLLHVLGKDNPGTPDIEGHTGAVQSIAVSPDGSMLASGSTDMNIILVNVDTGKIVHVLKGNTTEVYIIRFVPPDGKTLFSLSSDSSFRRWNTDTGLETTPISMPVGGNPLCMAPSPDGKLMYVCSRSIWIWNVQLFEQKNRLEDTLEGKGSEVAGQLLTLAASRDGRFIVAGSVDGVIWVWNTPVNAEIRQFSTDGTLLTTDAVSGDGRYLLTGTNAPCGAILWDIKTGQPIRRFVADGGANLAAIGTQLSADGRRVLFGCSDFFGGTQTTWLSLWDAQTGKEIHHMVGHRFTIWRSTMSENGRFALTGSATISPGVDCCPDDLLLWDLDSGSLLKRMDTKFPVQGVDLTRDGKIAVVGAGEETMLWDMANDRVIRRYACPGGVQSIAFSPDETTILGTTVGPFLIKWNTATGETLWKKPMDNESWSVQVSADSRYALTRELNTGNIVIWDYQTGEKLQVLGSHTGIPPITVFDPSGNSVYSSGLDGNVIEWQVGDWSLDKLLAWIQGNRYVRELTCDERVQYGARPLCEAKAE